MMAAPRLGTESPPLYAAVENRDLARVEKLLGEGASVNTPGDLGFTPLHLAAMRGYTEILSRLLSHPGTNCEVRDSMEETPLMLAACYHHSDAVMLLLESGANPRAVDWRGKDALEYASKNHAHGKKSEQYEKCVQILQKAKGIEVSDVRTPSKLGSAEEALAQFLSGDSIKPNLTAKQSKVAMYSQFPINDPGTPSLMNLNLQPMPPAPQGGSKPATLKQPPPPASSAAARKLAATQPPAKHPLPPRGPGSYSKTANPNSSPGLAAFGAHGHQSASLSKKGLSSKETEETLKNKGNSAFGQENYTKAADFYTQALQINESNHILYSNRSAAYLALNQPTLAKLDAIKCVGIEPKYVKGHFRLAQAHLALEDYDRALRDIETGLRLDPSEAAFLELKTKVEGIIAQRDFVPPDQRVEGITGYPPAKYLHPQRDVIFTSGESEDGSLRTWSGIVHYVDAALWSSCLQFRTVVRNAGSTTIVLSKDDIMSWQLHLRNKLTILRPKPPEHDKDPLFDHGNMSIIELNGQDVSSRHLSNVTLAPNNWTVVTCAFKVAASRFENEALKRCLRLVVRLNTKADAQNIVEMSCLFNLELIRKYYKGFVPGLVCGQPRNSSHVALFPKWRKEPGYTPELVDEKYDDEAMMNAFSIRARDADSKFNVFTTVWMRSWTVEEMKNRIKETLDPDGLRSEVRLLTKLPEKVFLDTDADLQKYTVGEDAEIEVDFAPSPLDDID